nr:immunoglobulin light chain junction region [Macaca mulatta]
CLQESKWPWTF